MYRINEIFYSLQGEGMHSGRPTVFIRTSGCNLACPWCDTDFSRSTEMTAEQIIDAIRLCLPDGEKPEFVVLTGGEPALQVDEPLVEALHQAGYRVHIETNGTRPLPQGIDWITCSPKEGSRLALTEADEVKVVYTGVNPEHWRNDIRTNYWLLQPLDRKDNNNVTETAQYVLAHPNWKLSLQIHKILRMR